MIDRQSPTKDIAGNAISSVLGSLSWGNNLPGVDPEFSQDDNR